MSHTSNPKDSLTSDPACQGPGEGASGGQPSYYGVLGVAPEASRREIREAYMRLRETYSEDSQALYSLVTPESAMGVLQQIETAFRVLNDNMQRRAYDAAYGFADPGAGTRDRPGSAPHVARIDAIRRYEALRNGADGVGGELPSDFAGHAATHGGDRSSQSAQGGASESRSLEAGCVPGAELRIVPSRSAVVPVLAPRSMDPSVQAQMKSMIEESDKGDGDLYKRLREAAGVSVDEMRERTKVMSDYIEAMEANRFERLPAVVFAKGFLKSYLRYLGVDDPGPMVQAFGRRLEEYQRGRE